MFFFLESNTSCAQFLLAIFLYKCNIVFIPIKFRFLTKTEISDIAGNKHVYFS